jgi:hypothetical protein
MLAKSKTWGCVLVSLLAAGMDSALAQRGVVNGQIVERKGFIPGYGSYRLPGTDENASLDKQGRFRIELLPGRYDLDVLVAPGEPVERKTVVIKANETLDLIITGPEGSGRRSRPTNVEQQTPPGMEIAPMDSVRVIYHPQTEPVIAKSLTFTVRYEMTEVGDSIRVNVIAEGRNSADAPVSTCGCFSFWRIRFGFGPEQVMDIPLANVKDWYTGPKLEVAPVECTTSTLDCAPTTLAPGESVSRSMSFSFRPADFAEMTGELHVRTYYFTGAPGTEWHDAERIDLGTLAVPIRLPGTVGRYGGF